MVTGTNYSY